MSKIVILPIVRVFILLCHGAVILVSLWEAQKLQQSCCWWIRFKNSWGKLMYLYIAAWKLVLFCFCKLAYSEENCHLINMQGLAAGDSELQVAVTVLWPLAFFGQHVLLMCCHCFGLMALLPVYIRPWHEVRVSQNLSRSWIKFAAMKKDS